MTAIANSLKLKFQLVKTNIKSPDIDIPPYQWNSLNEDKQINWCLQYFNNITNLPESLVYYDASKVNKAARLQTEAQLLVANFWSNYDVLALLTDLNDYWEYFWLDGNDVCFWKIEERAKAVAILKDYVNVVGVNDIGRIGSEVGMSIDYPIGKRRKLDTNELVTVPSSDIANMEDFADEMSEIELKQWRVRCLMRKFFSMPYPQTVLAEVIEDDKFPSHIK
ncbi:15575_t:CDS:2 [Entrophospora sp. SA101]|nr:14743_t:CDS:2 [Entrophospora sp. SA101]CAJ0828078.1 15575_t:CDS:2 [Entrophospora sp. SA101]CAJ0845843.1 12802_t:CDS:2 [Entrophospora sp. SA101]